MNGFESILSRPRLWLQDKEGQPLLTDLVLHTYARQLFTINSKCSRSFDLSAAGLPVGARRITTFEQLLDLCKTTTTVTEDKVKTAGMSEKLRRPNHEAVREFCRQEQGLLTEFLRTIDESRKNHPNDLTPVEYLLLPLPEVDPDRSLSPPHLNRIKSNALALSRRLQQTQAALVDHH
jgi:hypothetical protein